MRDIRFHCGQCGVGEEGVITPYREQRIGVVLVGHPAHDEPGGDVVAGARGGGGGGFGGPRPRGTTPRGPGAPPPPAEPPPPRPPPPAPGPRPGRRAPSGPDGAMSPRPP